jgi:hypothetical protein
MVRNSKAVSQYLTTYAEPEIQSIPNLSAPYDHCLVIPAYNETWGNLQKVWQNLRDNYLAILIVNSPEERHLVTCQLLQEVKDQYSIHTAQGPCTYLHGNQQGNQHGNPDILLVDRCSDGNTIESRHGVGLARKIGADIALQLISDRVVLSNRISVTDADAELPADYFSYNLNPSDAALSFAFEHRATSGAELPTLLYDLSLLYYACGLDWAGSAYAYTSLGSTLAINSNHYAMVRGFPRRSAAEDFYLLNKLAKTGRVRRIGHSPIILSGRLSDRVPVGTGPGIAKILALENPAIEYLFYNPGIFTLLKDFQKALASVWQTPEAMLATGKEIRAYCNVMSLDQLISEQHQRHNKKTTFDKFLTDWFDGFKTLKFIHFMRDQFLPSVPFSRLGEAPFLATGPATDPTSRRRQMHSRLFPDTR